ncbi:MAG: alpha-L-rhamnosidase, partial [Lentisphaeria bacterium]|nr:alpha-L-rhamnosidase [Lentisphaeria bacterium]
YSYIGADGRECCGEFRFLDWPSADSPPAVHAGLQGLLTWALTAGEKLCMVLGNHCEAQKCAGYLQRLKSYCPDCGNRKSAAALLSISGLADAAEINKTVLAAEPCSNLSTFLGYYVLEARALAGDKSGALDIIRRYWGGMLDMGATSFWEDFDLKWCTNATRIDEMPVSGRPDIHADFGNHCYKGLRHSLCHGWAAGPAAWCAQKILGGSPAEPGFKKVKFTPDLCGLEWAKGTVPTPYGVITVSLEKGKAPNIILPSGTELSD